jgi:hypothetical protein
MASKFFSANKLEINKKEKLAQFALEIKFIYFIIVFS